MSIKPITLAAARCAFAALILCLAALAWPEGAAAANGRVTLGPMGSGELQTACAANGGRFSSSASGASYDCYGAAGHVSCHQNQANGSTRCEGYCSNCSDIIRQHGKGVVGGAGTAGNARGTVQAHSVSSNKVKPVVAASHLPLKKLAGGRAARAH
jgi:hypothetical protein